MIEKSSFSLVCFLIGACFVAMGLSHYAAVLSQESSRVPPIDLVVEYCESQKGVAEIVTASNKEEQVVVCTIIN